MSESLRVSTLARAPDLCLCAVLYHVSAQPSSQANSAKLIFCTSTRLPRGPLTAASRTVLAVSGFILRLPHYRRAALLMLFPAFFCFYTFLQRPSHGLEIIGIIVAPGAQSFWPIADSVGVTSLLPPIRLWEASSLLCRAPPRASRHSSGALTGGVQRYLELS